MCPCKSFLRISLQVHFDFRFSTNQMSPTKFVSEVYQQANIIYSIVLHSYLDLDFYCGSGTSVAHQTSKYIEHPHFYPVPFSIRNQVHPHGLTPATGTTERPNSHRAKSKGKVETFI